MRNKKEMFDLIIKTAKDDSRIRAAIMTGSRSNPNIPKDMFQDFDIIYVVTDINSFTNDYEWINQFGEIMIMQTPELIEDTPPKNDGSFTFLMQFKDGNRIDLCLYPINKISELKLDSLSVLLLDKYECIGQLPPPSDHDYHVVPPTAKQFLDCCNEFWWTCAYVPKGLWRDEIPYTKVMIDNVVREAFNKMITWYIGVKTGFTKNVGKHGKYFKNYLEPELWEEFLSTYPDADSENIWDSLFAMCQMFRELATSVAIHFNYDYPIMDDENVILFLNHIRDSSRINGKKIEDNNI